MHTIWAMLPALAQYPALAYGNLFEACPGHTIGSLVQCAEHHRKSQFAEDVSLLPSLLLGSSKSCARRRAEHEESQSSEVHIRPTFVELGAFDGIIFSNTFLLEVCCSWTGVLLEANPDNFAKLKEDSHRNATMVHSGVCDQPGSFNITRAGGVFAGRAEEVSERFRHRSYVRAGNIEVPCHKLSSILEREKHHQTGFMSLDVEGSEERVLRNTDLHRISVLLFEIQNLDLKQKNSIDAALTNAGLVRSNATIRESRVYVRAGLPVLSYPYQTYPPRFSHEELRTALQEASSRCQGSMAGGAGGTS